MLKIKRRNFESVNHFYDYELEDGTYLHETEWNGEHYAIKIGKEEKIYTPIYVNEFTDDEELIGFK